MPAVRHAQHGQNHGRPRAAVDRREPAAADVVVSSTLGVWVRGRQPGLPACPPNFGRARSRLYRGRFLSVHFHFAEFFEIYKIVTPAHPSKLKISTKFHQTFPHFCIFFCTNRHFSIRFIDFRADSDQIFSEFRNIL